MRHVAAEPPLEIAHALSQRTRDDVVARLGLAGPPVVAPRGVVRRQRLRDEARDERVAILVAIGQQVAELVLHERRREVLKPGAEDRGRGAVAAGVERPAPQQIDSLAIGRRRGLRVRQQQRQQRLRVERERVGLHPREVVRRESPVGLHVDRVQQIDGALRAVRFGPLETEMIRIGRRRRTMIRRDDRMRGRIVEVRQVVERNPAGPFTGAAPAVGGNRSVARRADGHFAGRVVADVAGHVGVDEVLRRRHEVPKRGGELGPVPRVVEAQERGNGRVLAIECGPAERERLERRRLRSRLARSGVVRVERVRDERTVPRDADVDADRRAALDRDRFGDHDDALLCATELGELARRVEMLAVQIFDIGGDVGGAPRDEAIASERDGRRARQRRADHLEIAADHVREIPGGRQPRAEMRIVGQERLAASRQRAVDDPVVRTDRLSARVAEQKIADGRIAGRERAEKRRGVGRAGLAGQAGLVGRVGRVGRVGGY